MIRCLLFGHEPHPTFETSRGEVGDVLRRITFCVRCGQLLAAHVGDVPLPNGSMTTEERDAVLIDSLIQRLMPELKVMLLPHLLKRKRPVRRSPALTETET